MARTFIASNPQTGEQQVIVEVRPDLAGGAADADIEHFERRLYERRLQAGLIITPPHVYFIRDTLMRLDFSPESYAVDKLQTETFFGRIYHGRAPSRNVLDYQTKRWLEAVAKSWSTFVPDEAVPLMLPELVAGLADAELSEVDGLLSGEDAAQ